MKANKNIYFLIFSLFFLISCNWGHEVSEKRTLVEKKDSTDFINIEAPSKAKTGVGPITEEVKLGLQIDEKMAAKGEEIFKTQCANCHEIHETNRGPALGGVLEKRSPQWVMNMILNPDGMIENDPQVKALKDVYELRMVDLNLSEEEARQVVEYLRTY